MLVGSREMRALGVESAYSMVDMVGEERSFGDPAGALADVAARVARSWSVLSPVPWLRLIVVGRVVLVVGLGADDREVAVELDVDLAAVVEGDLDLVVALLVADLGAGHLPLAGLVQRRPPRLLQGRALDRTLGRVVVGAGKGDTTTPDHDGGGGGGGQGGLLGCSCLQSGPSRLKPP